MWPASISHIGVAPSKKGPMVSFCTVCSVDFSISGGGAHEVERHCDSARHNNSLLGVSAQPRISSVMATVSESEKVLRSELYFAHFVAEHNLPFATVDHFTWLCKVMFPDSKVADSFFMLNEGAYSCNSIHVLIQITCSFTPSQASKKSTK